MTITLEEFERRFINRQFDDLTKLKLNIDAYRLHLRHKFDPVSVVAIGKIDPLPHQIESFVKMISMLRLQSGIEGRIRMLLADDVGLGKTIMVGLVAKELLLRKKINRILIVAPSGLQIQWKEEMEEKFNETFDIIRGKIENNPYRATNTAIISVDMGRNIEKRDLLMQATWDIIIFDEAHKLKPGSLRYDFALDLSKRTKHLILASATPHDGKIENFIGLVKLVDEEIESNNQGELKKYLEPLMIRRLKEDIVNFKGKKIFPKREQPITVNVEYSSEEKIFYDRVEDYVKTYYQTAESAGKQTAILALYILHRRVSSSIEAGFKSLKKRKLRLLEPYIDLDANRELNYLDYLDENDDIAKEKAEEILLGATASTGEDLKKELRDLDDLIQIGKNLLEKNIDSKSKKLLELVNTMRNELPKDKIIIFTEFTDTLQFLEKNLTKEGFLISKIKGGMDIEEKKRQSRMFETSSDILLGTEAAGEGLNLQFANIVINYELPWNPNRLEQRIGRVYRYGQKKKVFIRNFKTAFPIDDAVLRKIQEKMENIRAIFGDHAIDVIGSLISEKEILEIFKAARSVGSGVDKIDEILIEKTKILDKIDQFLIKNQVNLTQVQQNTRDLSQCINNFDVERFFLSYVIDNPLADHKPQRDSSYYFSIPALDISGQPSCTTIESGLNIQYDFSGSFNLDSKSKYIALGHPALERTLHHSMTKNCVSLISSDKKGLLISYIIRFYNGTGKEIYAEPILLKKTENDLEIINHNLLWEMKEVNKNFNIELSKDYLTLNKNIMENPKSIITGQVNDIEDFVRNRNMKDLDTEYKFILTEYDWKIKNQKIKKQMHLEKGQNYLLPGIEKRITQLKQELRDVLKTIEESKNITWDVCGPIDIALLIPSEDILRKEDIQPHEKGLNFEEIVKLRKKIEDIGMKEAMTYEKNHDRSPTDVSHEFYRGYDIISKSKNETRHIEVKSLAEVNPIQISSNEWRTASQLREDYYLYVVQYALSDPKLTVIKDPFENLEKYIKKVPVEDFKIVLDKLPNDIEYEEKP